MLRLHRSTPARTALASIVLCSALANAEVYRCNENGNTVYSDRPCQTGAQHRVAVSAAPVSEPQRNFAQENRAIDQRLRAKLDADQAELRAYRQDLDDRRARADAAERQQAAQANLDALERELRQQIADNYNSRLVNHSLLRRHADPAPPISKSAAVPANRSERTP